MRAILIVLGCILAAGLLVACANGKSNHAIVVEENQQARDWAQEGFIPVTVSYDLSREEPCKLLLVEDGSGQIWEPMGLDKTLMTDGTKLWAKLQRQRRPSQCKGIACGVEEAYIRP